MPAIGLDCNLTLQNPNVNLNQAVGFLIRPDSLRVLLPKVWYRGTNAAAVVSASPIAAGKRVLEFVVLCMTHPVARDGTIVGETAESYHDTLRAFAARVNEATTLVDPDGVTYTVCIEEMEDRLAPEGGQFLLRWETRLVFVEV